VIEAFKQARQEVDATLVLLGNFATDDPEGAVISEALLRSRELWVLRRQRPSIHCRVERWPSCRNRLARVSA
jgi:hypothetical protein